MEAQRTSIGGVRNPYETFAVKGERRSYQVTYYYYSNAWHVADRYGHRIDPFGRVGAKVVDACRERRRTV